MLIFPQPDLMELIGGTCDSKGSTCYSAGGGAGGTVLIQAATTTGMATISVNGGISTIGGGGYAWQGGGGAGGRIAIIASSSFGNFTTTAYGASGYQYGGAGSIYLSSSTASPSLTYNNNLSTITGAVSKLPYSYVGTSTALFTNGSVFGVVNGTSTLYSILLTSGTTTLSITSSTTALTLGGLTINSGAILNHPANSISQQYAINLNILGNLAVNGSINVDYLGLAG